MAAEMLVQQRIKHLESKKQADNTVIKHLSKLTSSLNESKAEKCQNRLEKLVRDRERLPVSPREQPRRQAAAEVEYYHPDSEDLDSSDDSSSSVELEELLDTPYGVLVTDTENISGVDKKEFRAETKKKRKHITNPRTYFCA